MKNNICRKSKKLQKFINDNKDFLILFLIPTLIFLVLFFAYYPGIIPYDGNNQWQQVQSGVITNAHPFFSTYFMYLLSKIHNTTTPVIIFQIFLFSFIWAYFVNSLKLKGNKRIISIIFTFIMSLVPIISLYSITLWKDVLYTYYLFLCGVLFFNIFINKKQNKFNYIMLAVSIAMVFSYRHNGIIASILLLIYILLSAIKSRNKKNFKKTIIIIIIFLSIVTLIAIPKKYYLNKSDKVLKNNNEISYSAIDSYILWMSGAHLKDNNIKNKKDLNFFNNIIPIKEWKKVYNPYLINNTGLAKNLNKKYVIKNDAKLKKLFIKYTERYPLTIIVHYVKADALLINPVSQLNTYVYVFSFSSWEKGDLNFDSITNSKIPPVQNVYNKFINISFIKCFRLFYQPAFILYLTIIMILILIIRKIYSKKLWLLALPMLANTISLLPINLAQDLRYVYINYLTFFAVLLLFILNLDKIFKRKKVKKV